MRRSASSLVLSLSLSLSLPAALAIALEGTASSQDALDVSRPTGAEVLLKGLICWFWEDPPEDCMDLWGDNPCTVHVSCNREALAGLIAQVGQGLVCYLGLAGAGFTQSCQKLMLITSSPGLSSIRPDRR